MNILEIGIVAFLCLESLNVLMLYSAPGMKKGNAVGVFNAWEDAQKDQKMKRFVHYMAAWVAGTKLIFIMVGIVIVIWGNIETQLATAGALLLSVSAFFWRLYPAIKLMDAEGEINPPGYSKTLKNMIIGFILGFVIIFVFGLIKYFGN